jgi:perosamine synthetase
VTKEIRCGIATITSDDIAAVTRTLESGFVHRGETVRQFEEAFAELMGATHAVAVSSGTAGLQLATHALKVDAGNRWISTPNTFVRTVNAVAHGGGTPVLVDINPDTWLVDLAQVTAAIERHNAPGDAKLAKDTEKPKDAEGVSDGGEDHENTRRNKTVAGVLPVHFGGLPVNIEALARVAKPRGVHIIEDASYGLGAMWEDSRGQTHTVGDCSYSDMTVFSFDPNKTITTGEGGMVTTNDDALAERLRLLRDHGVEHDIANMPDAPGPWHFEMRELGFNFRMSDLNAALGLSQLGRLAASVQRRRDHAAIYDQLLGEVEGVALQRQPKYAFSSYTFYVVRVDFAAFGKTRRTVMETLEDKGIFTEVHYVPLHLQPYYQERFGFQEGQFPIAEQYYAEALSLPISGALEAEDIERVVTELLAVLTAE